MQIRELTRATSSYNVDDLPPHDVSIFDRQLSGHQLTSLYRSAAAQQHHQSSIDPRLVFFILAAVTEDGNDDDDDDDDDDTVR